MQQGRLIVDADWNEQSAILLQQIRNLTTDLIGWHGGPGVMSELKNSGGTNDLYPQPTGGPLAVVNKGSVNETRIEIEAGRYYIDGIAHEWQRSPKEGTYDFAKLTEKLGSVDTASTGGKNALLIYADIHERLVVSAEDPDLLDPGLNGLDTTARQTVVGKLRGKMVKYVQGDATDKTTIDDKIISSLKFNREFFPNMDPETSRTDLPQLKASTKRDLTDPAACDPSHNSGFSGFENQLYRIEVHTVSPDIQNNPFGSATFKWSRDNGSIVYAGIRTGNSVTLKSKWRDDSKAIEKGNYVELIAIGDDFGGLFKVVDVIENDGVINLRVAIETTNEGVNSKDRPVIVRRWDHQNRPNITPIYSDGGFTVAKSTENNNNMSIEFPIEDGLFVQLDLSGDAKFKPGDHWLIPARSSTGDILWPREGDNYKFVPARSVEHHYAPIALLQLTGDKTSVEKIIDLRRNMTVVS